VFTALRSRRLRLLLVGLALALLVALAALHALPVRQWARRQAESRFARVLHGRVEIDALDYNLLTLRVRARGVRLSGPAAGSRPYFEADRADIDLPWRGLRRVRIESLRLGPARLRIGELREYLAGRPTSTGPGLERLEIGQLSAERLDILNGDSNWPVAIDLPRLVLDGVGTEPGTAGGTVQASGAGRIRIGTTDIPVERVQGGIGLDGQAVRLAQVRLGGPDVDLRLSGEIRLMGPGTGYTLDADLGADAGWMGRFAPELPALSGRLSGTAQVTGPLGEPRVAFQAEGPSLTLDGRPASLAVSGRWADDRWVFDDARLVSRGGRATLTGALPSDTRPGAGTLTWANLPVDALARWSGWTVGPLSGLSSGTASLEHWPAGGRPGKAHVLGQVRAGGGAGIPVAGRFELTLEGSAWTGRVTAATLGTTAAEVLVGGRLLAAPAAPLSAASLTGSARLVSADMADALRTARALGVPIAEEAIEVASGRATTDLALSGTVGHPVASGSLHVDDWRWLGVPVTATGRVRVDKTRLDLDAVEASQGVNAVTGAISIDTKRSLVAGRFDADLQDLPTALARWSHPLQLTAGVARVTGTLAGPLSSPDIDAEVDGAGVAVAGQRVARASGALRLRRAVLEVPRLDLADSGGLLAASGRVNLATGAVEVDALSVHDYPVSPVVYAAAHASGEAATVTIPISMRLDVEAAGRGRREMLEGAATFAVRDLAWETFRIGAIEGEVSADGRQARWTAESAALAATTTGSADITPGFPFTARVSLRGTDAATVARVLGERAVRLDPSGSADADLALSGRLDAPGEIALEGALTRAVLVVARVPITLEQPARLRMRGQEVLDLAATWRTGSTTVRVSRTPAAALTALVDGRLEDVAPWLPPVGGEAVGMTGAVRAGVTLGASLHAIAPSGHVLVSEAEVRIPGLAPITGLVLRGVVAGGRVAVERVGGTWNQARLEASGTLPLRFATPWLPAAVADRIAPADDEGPARAEMRVTNLTMAVARQFIGAEALPRVDGLLELAVLASAERPELDAVVADGTLTRATLRVSDITLQQPRPATIAIRDSTISVSDLAWIGPNTNITTTAGVEFGRGAPVYDLAVDGAFDLRVLGPVAGGRLGGVVRGQVTGRGQSGAVAWGGHLEVEDGALLLRRQQIALLDVQTTLDLVEDRLQITGFTGRLNGGAVEGAGEIASREEGLRGRITATLRGVGLELPEGTRHDLDGELTLTLDEASVLSGSLTAQSTTVENSIVSLATLVTSFQASPDLPTEAPTPRPLAGKVALDIGLATADDLVFDSNDLRLAATADLRIVGTAAEPRLRGRASLREGGEIFLAGRIWEIENGNLDFVEGRGSPVDVRLAVTAVARISRYEVLMRINGAPEELAVSLSSDPPLGQTDLTELVTTGGVSARDSTQRGSYQVAGAISAELLGSVGRAFGLDTIRIEQTEPDLSSTDLEPVARLTASKRLGPHFEVVYSQSLAETDDLAWLLLYRPGWYDMEVRFTYRTQGGETLELRQELEFGGHASRLSDTTTRPPAPRVASVEVTGLSPAGAAEVREQLKTSPGRRFDSRTWQRDEERVLRTFRARDHLLVRVRPTRSTEPDGRIALRMQVTPGPVTRLAVRGYAPSEDTVDAMRATWSRVVLEEFLEDELVRPLRLELARAGYLRPELRVVFHPIGEDGREAVVEVSPGVRSAQREVRFSGNAQLPAEVLEAALRDGRVRERMWVRPELVEPLLEGMYRGQGFLDADVTVLATRFEGERAILPVQVSEGPQFRVGDLRVTGAARLGDDRTRAALGLPPGSVYLPSALPKAVSRLRTAYFQAGFRDADVEAAPSRAPERPGTVDLTVSVREGRRSVLGEVAFDNRANASPGLVDAVTRLETGGALDSVALDRAQQRLYDTGIFRSVLVDVEPLGRSTGGDELVRAVVRLEERPRYRLRYGLQFGQGTIEDVTGSTYSAEPGVTLDLLRRNLFGRGVSIGAGGYLSRSQYRARGTATATTFFGRFATTTLTAERADQDRTLSNGVDFLDRSNRLIAEQRWRRGRARTLELSYGIDIDGRTLAFSTGARELAELAARVAGLTGTVTLDTRDNLFNPHRGQFHSSRIDGGPGNWVSDVAYGRYQVQQYVYLPAGPIVLASAFRFGTLDVDKEDELAGLLLRFKVGGGSTVRGYDQDSLSPRYFLGLPVGGNVMLVLNEEVRFPIYRWLGAVAFVDWGNAFEGFDTFSWSDLKVGTGIGLRLNTPVVVVRLDVGFPVPRPDNEPLARWYFGIGHAF
jgi:outer membrane protein assembly factor BamA